MLTTKAYLFAWILTLLAAGGLLLVVFRLTRGLRPVALRVVIRAVSALWLLMPAVVDPDANPETMAPALIVALFEMIGGYAEAARVIEPMLILTAAIIPLALFGHWGWIRWQAQRASRRNGRVPV